MEIDVPVGVEIIDPGSLAIVLHHLRGHANRSASRPKRKDGLALFRFFPLKVLLQLLNQRRMKRNFVRPLVLRVYHSDKQVARQ